MNLARLKEPFPPGDIEWRLQSAGKKGGRIWARCIAYVTNRAIMNRLDDVCGPENWRNEFAAAPAGGVMCGLSIKVAGEWVTKWDGAENTDIEAVKGGLSGAMKRAAVQWGVGRYLYLLDDGFADVTDSGDYPGRLKKEDGGDRFRWNPPKLPAWALPGAKLPSEPERRAPDPEPDDTEQQAAEDENERCTLEQAQLIDRMVRSHVITDKERTPILNRLLNGEMSKKRAHDCIEWLKVEIPARKAIEKAEREEAEAQ